MASENTMIDDTVAPSRIRHNRDRQMIRCRDSGEPEEPMAAVNVIVDDSSDDDLIEIGESQCIKQVHLVMSFKRRIKCKLMYLQMNNYLIPLILGNVCLFGH